MSLPTWNEIKNTSAYKEGRREVADLIQAAIYPTAAHIEKLTARVVELEAEASRLKTAQQERAARVRDAGGTVLEIPDFGAV